MELIQWRDEFRSGIPEIDRDHEELIQEINELWKPVAAKKERQLIKEFLDRVHEDIAKHFSREEAIMEARHYDQYPEHKTQHQMLLTEIRDIADDYAEGFNDYDPEDMLQKRVSAWFTQHIATHDVRLEKLTS